MSLLSKPVDVELSVPVVLVLFLAANAEVVNYLLLKVLLPLQ